LLIYKILINKKNLTKINLLLYISYHFVFITNNERNINKKYEK